MKILSRKFILTTLSVFLLASLLSFPRLDDLSLAQTPPSYNQEVEEGLQYFRKLANEQLSLAETLVAAIKSGDLEKAKATYVEARPPYEQIEVFAGSFEQEDSDIDARPYAFDDGEESPDFKGFHRIEGFLYRDGNLKAAIPYSEELVASIRSLINKLNDPSNFSAASNFEGMIAVATEVPAKKISSEEETWSDQSLLIFKNNWEGIYSQYKPFASLLNQNIATRVDAGYQACMNAIAPFFKSNQVAATPYSSLTNQDRRKIVEASYQFRDALLEARAALNLS
ncbi:MAG: EfeM/EfeO family lipoprotein [Okeania sp. SIO2C2]|uniref:EfeM/EfeO family lipoprotein n=1 Tax=Okeania sp. SIO2C2 TaxID=2607787 RepID=UPI0013BCEDD1|nr:EfeM/EfeO family lipoprotein [Okeania sp. SIO2C2]NEP86688.1 EfeM/EfeO family lipoprotein [Okeania sp. SIO2C2]